MARVRGLRVVRDAAGRFELSVPASWEVQTAPPGRGAVALVARARGTLDAFAPNITVAADDIPPATTSEAYGRGAMASLRSRVRGLRVLSEGPADVGGAPGYVRVWTGIVGNGTPVYVIQAYLAHDGLGLVATGSTLNAPASISRDGRILRDAVLSLRALGSAAQSSGAGIPGQAGAEARRDLFAPPPGANGSAEPGQGGVPLPPVPSAGGAPLPRLAAVVLGPAPQAVLKRADGTYAIVHQSERTPWGTVAAIRSTGVVLDTGSGTRTISWAGGSR